MGQIPGQLSRVRHPLRWFTSHAEAIKYLTHSPEAARQMLLFGNVTVGVAPPEGVADNEAREWQGRDCLDNARRRQLGKAGP